MRRPAIAACLEGSTTVPTPMTVLEISAGPLSAAFAPELGGRLARLSHSGTGGRQELVIPLAGWGDDPLRWPKAGAYPLVPYSNRIAAGRLRIGARSLSLQPHPDATPHSLHGPAQLRPWRLADHGADHLAMEIDYAADADWPWCFQARQAFRLDPGGLDLTLSITNADETVMPAGLGWHPYFSLPQGSAVRHDAQVWWPYDADSLSHGDSVRIEAAGDPLAEQDSAYLSEWRRTVLAGGAGPRLTLTADGLFEHLVIHHPPDRAYVCIEPVSHVSDGFNLAAAGVAGTGTRYLEPGETLSGRIRLAVEA
jgi:aldose 1-epimerase